MTLRHLQIFRQVCISRGITAAAEELNMTQPAVSLAIRELEAFYGTKLFDRMNRRIFPTQEGLLLKQYADSIINDFDEAYSALKEETSALGFRFAVNVSVAETLLAKIMNELYAAFDGAGIEVKVDNNEAISEMTDSGGIDFALADSVPEGHDWEVREICEDTMRVLSPEKTQEMTLAELAGKRLLLREKGSGSRSCVDAVFLSRGLRAEPAIESKSTLALIELCRAGLGFTVMPGRLADRLESRGGIFTVPVRDAEFRRRYYLIHHRKKYLSKTARAAIETICRACEE